MAAMLYFGAVIPGGLGFLTGPVVAGTTVALGAAALALAPRLGAARPVQGGAVPTMAVAAIAGAMPLLASREANAAYDYVLHIFKNLTQDFPVLNWDVVSYHLPALIEFTQNQTLWSFEGPFQGYCFGFEILGVLPFMLEGKLFGTVLATLLSLILVAVAAASLGEMFVGRRVGIVARLFVAGGAALLVVLGLAEETAQIGKNDTFAAAAVVAALVFTISALSAADDRLRLLSAILLSATALALAIATKPNMLGFGPIWGLSVLWLVWRRTNRRDAALLLPILAVIVALGGFFQLRNLAWFGSLTGVQIPQDTLLALNLTAKVRALLFDDPRLVWIIGGGLTLIGLAGRAPRDEREQWLLVLGWYASAVIVFGLTPYSLWLGNIVQWRFGMVAQILAMVAVMAAAVRVVAAVWARFARTLPQMLGRATTLGVAAGWMRFVSAVPAIPGRTAALVLVAAWSGLAVAPLVLARPSPPGLPGHDEFFGVSTGIYRWVQSRSGAERIYAAGLRPLGLFGRDWNNRVLYDLHSLPVLRYPDRARERLERVRQDFGPTLVILARDPHFKESDENDVKLLANWLAAQPCINEVYRDAVSTAFAVTPDCPRTGSGTTEAP